MINLEQFEYESLGQKRHIEIYNTRKEIGEIIDQRSSSGIKKAIEVWGREDVINDILKQQKIKKWIIKNKKPVYIVGTKFTNAGWTNFIMYYVKKNKLVQFEDYLNPYFTYKRMGVSSRAWVYECGAFGTDRSFEVPYQSFEYGVRAEFIS